MKIKRINLLPIMLLITFGTVVAYIHLIVPLDKVDVTDGRLIYGLHLLLHVGIIIALMFIIPGIISWALEKKLHIVEN